MSSLQDQINKELDKLPELSKYERVVLRSYVRYFLEVLGGKLRGTIDEEVKRFQEAVTRKGNEPLNHHETLVVRLYITRISTTLSPSS